MNLQKNQIINLNITSMTAEGSGVGKTEEGIAVFVPQSAVGDELKVRILKVKKTYAFGKIEEIITPSKDRKTPDCPYFNQCGGCVYRHITYDAEKAIKEQKVKDAVSRIGGIDESLVKPLLCSENSVRYRNKAQFPAGVNKDGNVILGFYAFHSHRIVKCDDCLLQPEIFKTVMDITLEFMAETKQTTYNEITGKGKLRHLYIRYGEKTDELMVCYVVNGNGLKQEDLLVEKLKVKLPNLKSVVVNSNREKTNVILGNKNRTVYGKGYITDILCDLKFKISPLSFYQVNRTTAEILYNKAKEYAGLTGDEVLFDLYCGTGTIGLSMAKNCKQLIGVEVVPQAIEDAKENARENNIENARFICADASQSAKTLEQEGIKPDVIIVDPPRKGLDKELIGTISRMSPKRVVYVSCDPATLARDLKIFDEYGYKTLEVTPVDMFPGTSHCESVVLLKQQIDIHNMNLHHTPFEMIKSGKKTIELRLFDEKRQQIKAGDKIIFTDTVTGESMNTTVVKLHLFDSFDELYKALPLLKCGYTKEDINNANPSDMEQYYSVEQQNKYGVVGIELLRF